MDIWIMKPISFLCVLGSLIPINMHDIKTLLITPTWG